MDRKKKLIWIGSVASALLLAAVLAKPLWYWYQDVSFYWREHTETELRVKAFAEEHRISIGRYPENAIALLEHNPETEEFVLNYPMARPEDTTLAGTPRQAVPHFLQWDRRWGYEIYGSDMIAVTGCGPTCLAMAHYYLVGDPEMTPARVARFAEENGYYAKGYGSSWTLISEGGGKLGLTVRELPLDENRINESLNAGLPVILALGPGDFTTAGHYIVLTGVEEGGYRVNDPNSRLRSEQLWPYEVLSGQVRNIWELGV